ncbi:MAG TPA: MmgE/PrpD family protein [Streptosporangiaceae bacterium]
MPAHTKPAQSQDGPVREPSGGGARDVPLNHALAEWAGGLSFADLPPDVVDYATSQVISHLGVIRAGLAHPLGQRLFRAYGPPTPGDPDRTAHLLAALSACLYYEDSMYVGHVSHSSVNVPLADQRALRLDGRRLLTAVVAANECAARVAAAAALGPLRGQTATYVQLVGAVAARLHAAAAPVRRWVDAWGLALAAPPWPLRRAFVGSDAKVLSAAVPVRIALDACAAAAAGVGGAPDILEHPDGFLAKFSAVPSPEVVLAGLGRRWHTQTLSFKVHPAGAYVDAAIDCATELYGRLRPGDLADVEEIVVSAPRLTMVMDAEARPYLDRGRSSIMALNLSVGYNVATVLLNGDITPADLAEPACSDPERWALAAKVRLAYEKGLSRSLLGATAPLGEALRQAGGRAHEWLADFSGGRIPSGLAPSGPPSATFERSTKMIGSQVEIVLRDGRRLVSSRAEAAGSAGPHTRRTHAAIARRKLLATGASGATADALGRLPTLDAGELTEVVEAALAF